MNLTTTYFRFILGLICMVSICSKTLADESFLMTQADTLYRFKASGSIQSFTLPEVVDALTTVPAGVGTVGNLNGGATAGDAILLGTNSIYRIDNPLSPTPSFVVVGNSASNNSPVFVGNRPFGIESNAPSSFLIEWDPSDFSEVNRWPTGVFGGTGGLAHVAGNTFVFSEFLSDQLWQFTIGGGPATSLGALPNHDYSGFERASDGTLYGSFALPNTGEMVFGTINDSNGNFNQLRVIDSYVIGGSNGITGLTIVVPEPNTMLVTFVLSAFGLCSHRQRING